MRFTYDPDANAASCTFVDELAEGHIARSEVCGRVGYYSSSNNITVLLENGRVVTVSSGPLKVR